MPLTMELSWSTVREPTQTTPPFFFLSSIRINLYCTSGTLDAAYVTAVWQPVPLTVKQHITQYK